MSMFGPKLGTWWVGSITDPRWNKDGQGYGLVCAGGPSEIRDWIDKCKEKYGDPPKDLNIGFMKD